MPRSAPDIAPSRAVVTSASRVHAGAEREQTLFTSNIPGVFPSAHPRGLSHRFEKPRICMIRVAFLLYMCLLGCQKNAAADSIQASQPPESSLPLAAKNTCRNNSEWKSLKSLGPSTTLNAKSSFGQFVVAKLPGEECALGFVRGRSSPSLINTSTDFCDDKMNHTQAFNHVAIYKNRSAEFHQFEASALGNATPTITYFVVIDSADQCITNATSETVDTISLDTNGSTAALSVKTTRSDANAYSSDTSATIYRVEKNKTHTTYFLRHVVSQKSLMVTGYLFDDSYRVYNYTPGIRPRGTQDFIPINEAGDECDLPNFWSSESDVTIELDEIVRSDGTILRRCMRVQPAQ